MLIRAVAAMFLAVVSLVVFTTVKVATRDAVKAGTIAMPFALVGVAAAFLALRRTNVWAQRIAQPGANLVRSVDERPPILLLRSFRSDNGHLVRFPLSSWMTYAFGWYRPLEFALTLEASEFGPVTAVGRPGEAIPPAGAAREYLAAESWRDVVIERAITACAILIVAETTRGVRWEVRQVSRLGLLGKTTFIIPPSSSRDRNLTTRYLSRRLAKEGRAIAGTLDSSAVLVFPEGDRSVAIFDRRAGRRRSLLPPPAHVWTRPLARQLDLQAESRRSEPNDGDGDLERVTDFRSVAPIYGHGTEAVSKRRLG